MPDKKVIGVAGNRTSSGIDTGEYLKKLDGLTGRQEFDKMRRSDPQIAATLRAIELPIRQTDYSVESASDNATDKEIAEIIEANILRGMSITWDDCLRQILLKLPFGFSIMEKCWEMRDGKVYLAKLDARLPMSIVDATQWGWDRKTGALKSIKQRASSGTSYDLPIEKLLVFTTAKEGDNWEGLSLLRCIYMPWKVKTDLIKIDVLKHDRGGVGVPDLVMPEGIKEGTEEWNRSIEVLENFCANEEAYIIRPAGSQFQIIGSEGKGTSAIESIKFHDEAIARALLAQFITLGTTQTGSRALGSSFIDFFLKSLQAETNYICDVFNRFLIREYVDYNWEVEEYPVFKAGLIQEVDPFTVAELQKAGLLSKDLDTENYFRKKYRLPEIEELPEPPPPPPTEKKPIPQAPDVKPDQIDEQASNQEEGEERKKIAASEKLLTKREDFPHIDFRGMELRLNEAATDYGQRIMQIKEAQRADIVEQLVAGKEVRNIRVIKKKEMYDLLMEAYREQSRAGGTDVREEIEAQGFKLAVKKKVPQTNEQMYSVYAQIQVDGAASKLVSTLAQQRANLLGQDLTEQDLKKQLDTVPVADQTWDAMVNGAVNTGWGDGREEEAEEYQDEIDHCIYTSVMDTSTCYRCEIKDGHEHALGDPEYETPNPQCAGRDWCRCMTIFVMKSEALPEAEYERRKG